MELTYDVRLGCACVSRPGGFSRDEDGAVLVEYAPTLALLTIACIAGASDIESTTFAAFNYEQAERMNYALGNNS
jgi:Flp pilus assembly pilin Flp